VDIHAMVPWDAWPLAPDGSPVRVALSLADQSLLLQAGRMREASDSGWHLEARATLATPSQPFEVVAERHVDWGDLPWARMLCWSLLVALLLLATRALLRQRRDLGRAEDLLRLGEATRLSTLGELGVGMAHELNPPLAAMVSSTEAAQRHLGDDPPDVPMAQLALMEVVDQARQAAQVLQRIRHAAEQPDASAQQRDVDLQEEVRKVLNMLESEVRRCGVSPELRAQGPAFRVRAQPMALEQVLHSLLMNALQALELVPPAERRLWVVLEADHTHGRMSLQDNGPGIRNEDLPHVFEPFFSTRNGGLGLGLSFSESLTTGMGGTLMAFNRSPRGAEFVLRLPMAVSLAGSSA
jgi:C4-dicarboxylate-specific signal transduction histidine kinase